MEQKQNKKAKWDYDSCYAVAKQYKSRRAFCKGCGSAYRFALHNNWLKDYTWFKVVIKKPSNYWTRKRCFEEAQKYKGRLEFAKNCRSAYDKAKSSGWITDYTWFEEKQKPVGYWTRERCFEEAKKYKSKSEFAKNANRPYTISLKEGWLVDYIWFEFPQTPSGYWTRERCFEEAKKYKSKSEFQKINPTVYGKSRRKGWLADYTWFQSKDVKFRNYWTYKRCFREAKKYKTQIGFKKRSSGAYASAWKNGWLKDYTWFETLHFSKETKLQLLDNIDLQDMSDHQLIELISVGAFPKSFRKLTQTEPGSEERKETIKSLKDVISSETKETEDNIEDTLEQEADKVIESEYQETDDYTPDEVTAQSLPELTTKELKVYDKFIKCYGEKNEYLTRESINRIWNNVLDNISYLNDVNEMRKTSSEWLSYVIDTFIDEYNLVINEHAPAGWARDFQPNLMQKLMAYRIANNSYYGNWCGTGAGKTIAFLMATRRVDARVSVCVCPNSVVDTIKESIEATFPNSNIVIIHSLDDIISFDRSQYNYIIFNYEKYQQRNSAKIVQKLVELNQIDFICFDEVHKAKNNESSRSKNLTNLRMLALTKNQNLKVLGMTATPLINNLGEVKTLLELLTGTNFDNIITTAKSIGNIHNAYKYLMLYGFRYVPDYNINCNEEVVKVDGSDQVDEFLNFKTTDINSIESASVHKKFDAITGKIKKHRTIIYTQFIKEIVPNIRKELKDRRFTYREYTGEVESAERKDIITRFANKEFDVILASSPISTGVDGLQEICDTIIVMSLPWTNAEYTQLIGRINRQGSKFTSVNIIIPQLTIKTNNEEWCWDEMRYKIIKNKKTLSDAVVDGRFTSIFTLNRSKLLREAMESLRKGIEDVNYERPLLMVDLSVCFESRKSNSVITTIHQKANTSTSSHMHDYFIANPDKWREYHDNRDENKKDWTIDPIDVIADKLNNECCNMVIADIGCGTNMLKTKVKSYKKWYSVDHYSDDPTVIKADAANLKDYIEDNSVDCAVFCLSLWGVNYLDSIKEAYRYLKPGGKMYIVKPEDKVNQDKILQEVLGMGFRLDGYSTDVDNKPKCTYIYYSKI